MTKPKRSLHPRQPLGDAPMPYRVRSERGTEEMLRDAVIFEDAPLWVRLSSPAEQRAWIEAVKRERRMRGVSRQ